MNKFEFMMNLERYRDIKPKDVVQHDSYSIPKQELHKIQSDYSKAPKAYKDKISLYKEYNEEDTISHAADFKYYQKIDLPGGGSRYFYTKEAWDAYNNPKKQKYHTTDPKDDRVIEYDEDGGNARKLNTTWQQQRQGAQMEADMAIERSIKEGGMKAGINAILRDDSMEEFFTQFEGGFENHGWKLNDDGSVTGMSDEDKKYMKKMSDWMRKFKDAEGNSLYDSKEFQDRVMSEIKNRYKIAQDLKNDPDREKKIAEEDANWEEENQKAGEAREKALKSVRDQEVKSDKAVKMYSEAAKENPKKVAKQIYKNRDFGLNELFHEVKEAIKDGAMIWDGSDLVAVSGSKSDKAKYNEANEYVNEIYKDMEQYINAIAEASGKGPEVWKEFRTLMTNKFSRLSDKYAPSKSK